MKKLISLLLALALLMACIAIPALAEEADIVIVGAGGGGLSAALEAVA